MIYIKKQFSEDHSYTYTSGKLLHFPHRLRLKETINFLIKKSRKNLNKIVDVGGGSGFLGDFLSKEILEIKSQKVYDIVHPLNDSNPLRKYFRPNLKTNFETFNLNEDNVNNLDLDINSLLICSETLEHIGNPILGAKKLINTIQNNKSDLYISYPIETGLKGINKFLQRLFFGKYFRKRSTISIFKQILWLLRIKKKFREKQDLYPYHDGFDDKELTNTIKKYCNDKPIDINIMHGFSTTHIYIKNK